MTADRFRPVEVPGALGIVKASRIAYRNMVWLLTANADRDDARDGAIAAAEIYYGACSHEAVQVANAWAAVGVGPTMAPCPLSGVMTSNDKTPPLYAVLMLRPGSAKAVSFAKPYQSEAIASQI